MVPSQTQVQAPVRSLDQRMEALKRAKVTWTTRYTKWYPSLEDTCRTEMAKLLQGSQTPQGFCDQIEAAAEKVRRDPRASGIPLCAECLGRTSPNVLRKMAD